MCFFNHAQHRGNGNRKENTVKNDLKLWSVYQDLDLKWKLMWVSDLPVWGSSMDHENGCGYEWDMGADLEDGGSGI